LEESIHIGKGEVNSLKEYGGCF